MIAHNDPLAEEDGQESLSSSTSFSPDLQPTDGSSYLTSLLYSTLVITVTDGRSFVGHFICTDREQNVILAQAEEFLPSSADRQEEEAERPMSVGAWGGREMGMVMIRGKDIVEIEAQLPLSMQQGDPAF